MSNIIEGNLPQETIFECKACKYKILHGEEILDEDKPPGIFIPVLPQGALIVNICPKCGTIQIPKQVLGELKKQMKEQNSSIIKPSSQDQTIIEHTRNPSI